MGFVCSRGGVGGVNRTGSYIQPAVLCHDRHETGLVAARQMGQVVLMSRVGRVDRTVLLLLLLLLADKGGRSRGRFVVRRRRRGRRVAVVGGVGDTADVPLTSGLTTDGRGRVDGRSHLGRRERRSDRGKCAPSTLLLLRGRRVPIPGVVLTRVMGLGVVIVDPPVRLGTIVERGRSVLGHGVRARSVRNGAVQVSGVDNRADGRQDHRVTVTIDHGMGGLVIHDGRGVRATTGDNVGFKLGVAVSEGLSHGVDRRGNGETVSDERGQALIDSTEPSVPFHDADREVKLERTQSIELEAVDLGQGEERDIRPGNVGKRPLLVIVNTKQRTGQSRLTKTYW